MRPVRVASLALLAALAICCEAAAADINIAGSEGWHTWQIDEVGTASDLCCFTWRRGDRSQKGCDLDTGHIAYGNGGDCAAAPGRIQYYALINDGRPAKIFALSSQCPVTTAAPVNDLGIVSTADNIAWFRSVIEDSKLGQSIREEALFGLVQSESDTAFEYIDSLLSSR
jgi:hypothetical protein